jgi:tight adherence protein B
VSPAAAAAFAAAALGVVAVWELAAAVEHAAVAAAIARVVAPLRRRGPAESHAEAAERRRLALLLAAVLGAAGWLLGGAVAGLLCAAAGPWLLARAVATRRERWREDLCAGAPIVARGIADALAAGRSIRGAISACAAAGGATRAADAELAATARAFALGARTDAVLERLRARAAAPAWDTIVAAILLQRDAGGDLAGLLRAIAADLEDARRAEADARTATAQARMTAQIVGVLPIGAAVVGELAAPGSLARMLGEPLPAALVVVAALLELVAMLLVRRLARLDRP